MQPVAFAGSPQGTDAELHKGGAPTDVTLEAMPDAGGDGTSDIAEAPGEHFRDCATCPEMVVLPAGSFAMGSPVSETGRQWNEGPVHRVTIAEPFAMGVYEVTFAEWNACADAGGCGGYRPKRRFFGRDWGAARQPVMSVGWDDVQGYLAWVSTETGKRYRLPSEAEWEYAARGGTTTPYYTGHVLTREQANYGRYFAGRPVPVGSYPPNAFGLYDMLGNVAEWCADCWNASHAGAPADGRPRLFGNCDRRVLRGGHWASDAEGFLTGVTPRSLRAASRSTGPEPTRMRRLRDRGTRDVTIGFRVARDL